VRPPLPGMRPGAKPGQSQGVRPALERQPTAEERRRSQRVLLRIPVLVHLKGRDKPMEGTTHIVSATGGMIILSQGLEAGTKFILENPRTQQKVEVNVVRPAQLNPALVPVEFLAAPHRFGTAPSRPA